MPFESMLTKRVPVTLRPFWVHKRYHQSGAAAAAANLSKWLPSTKDEPHLPRTNTELSERLSPLANLWGLSKNSSSFVTLNGDPDQERLSFLTKEQLNAVLSLPLPDDQQGWKETADIRKALYTAANTATTNQFGDKVHYRGLLEFSNICKNDCNYCGIRKSFKVPRYKLDEATIMEVAKWSAERQYGSLMLQSGEVVTPQRLRFLTKLIPKIIDETGMGISLSVGELPDEYYEQLRAAGVKRYLLRIETSNPELFASLHPPEQTFEARLDRLRALQRYGFMVGTGMLYKYAVGVLPFMHFVLTLGNDVVPFYEFPLNWSITYRSHDWCAGTKHWSFGRRLALLPERIRRHDWNGALYSATRDPHSRCLDPRTSRTVRSRRSERQGRSHARPIGAVGYSCCSHV